MAKAEVRMAIDPFRVIAQALKKTKTHRPLSTIVSVDYDEDADVLYAKFSHGKIVDSESLDSYGMVLASLDSRQHMIGLTIIHASEFS